MAVEEAEFGGGRQAEGDSLQGPAVSELVGQGPKEVRRVSGTFDIYNDPYVDAILHDFVAESLGMGPATTSKPLPEVEERLIPELPQSLVPTIPEPESSSCTSFETSDVKHPGPPSPEATESPSLGTAVVKHGRTHSSISTTGEGWAPLLLPPAGEVPPQPRTPEQRSESLVQPPPLGPLLSPFSPQKRHPPDNSHSGQLWEEAASKDEEAAVVLSTRVARAVTFEKKELPKPVQHGGSAGTVLSSTVVIPRYLLVEGGGFRGDKEGSGTPAPSAPLLAFVDTVCGGAEGLQLKQQLETALGNHQVFDLAMAAPDAVLEKMIARIERFVRIGDRLAAQVRERLRLLVCGNDASVGWVLSALQSLRLLTALPVAVAPLGKNNNLALSLGWGKRFQAADRLGVQALLLKVAAAESKFIDSWRCHMSMTQATTRRLELPSSLHSFKAADVQESGFLAYQGNFWNCIAVGLDAEAAYSTRQLEGRKPGLFQSRFARSSRGFCSCTSPRAMNVRAVAEVYSQDTQGEWKHLDLPPSIRTLVLLNLPSFNEKPDPWGQDRPETGKLGGACADDSLLEVLGFGDHGSQAIRLAQARAVRIEFHGMTSAETYLQLDGEPWRQPLNTSETSTPTVLDIECTSPCRMLVTEEACIRSLPVGPVQVMAGAAGRSIPAGTALSYVAPTTDAVVGAQMGVFLSRRFSAGGRIEGNKPPVFRSADLTASGKQSISLAKEAFRSSRSRIRSMADGLHEVDFEPVEDVTSPRVMAKDFFQTSNVREMTPEDYASMMRQSRDGALPSLKGAAEPGDDSKDLQRSFSGPVPSLKAKEGLPPFHSGPVQLPKPTTRKGRSPKTSPRASPKASPNASPKASPKASPLASPKPRASRSHSGPLPSLVSVDKPQQLNFFSGPFSKPIKPGGLPPQLEEVVKETIVEGEESKETEAEEMPTTASEVEVPENRPATPDRCCEGATSDEVGCDGVPSIQGDEKQKPADAAVRSPGQTVSSMPTEQWRVQRSHSGPLPSLLGSEVRANFISGPLSQVTLAAR